VKHVMSIIAFITIPKRQLLFQWEQNRVLLETWKYRVSVCQIYH